MGRSCHVGAAANAVLVRRLARLTDGASEAGPHPGGDPVDVPTGLPAGRYDGVSGFSSYHPEQRFVGGRSHRDQQRPLHGCGGAGEPIDGGVDDRVDQIGLVPLHQEALTRRLTVAHPPEIRVRSGPGNQGFPWTSAACSAANSAARERMPSLR